jgi:predicted Zn finger-like uncharacterized protein
MIEQALDRLQRLSVRRQGAYNAIIMSGPRLDHDVDFSCPHCGAQYVVSYTKLPIATVTASIVRFADRGWLNGTLPRNHPTNS